MPDKKINRLFTCCPFRLDIGTLALSYVNNLFSEPLERGRWWHPDLQPLIL